MSSPAPSIDEKVADSPKTESGDFEKEKVVLADSGVDVSVNLLAGHTDDAEVSDKESRQLRRLLDIRLLPLLFGVYILQYIDKTSLGASAVLGIMTDAHLDANQFNTLGSAFYIGYLVFEYPQNWALQRFPVAKWAAFNIFLWSLLIGMHPLCKNFGSLFVLRFLLGATESSITAGLMIVVSMFYTRIEIAERIGWTLQCNGIGTIISGFIAFGAFHTSPVHHPDQWQWLYIILAIATFVAAALFLAFFPDNPTSARFLSDEQKIRVVKRTKGNQNGVETKKWKKDQLIEAFTDPKTYLFFLFAAVSNLQNGLGAEYSLVIKGFGFTTLQTTLLNIPSGAAQIIGITLGCYMLRKMPNCRAYLAILFFLPSILAVGILLGLPLSNRVGLLSAIYVMSFGGAPSFAFVVGWVATTTAGHTKRLATNAVFLVGYALGQLLCTQFWKVQYRPRNAVPWWICMASYAGDIILLLAIRFLLDRENKRRDALQGIKPGEQPPESDEYGYVELVDENGNHIKKKVEKALLDLTDRQNLSFRYCL